MELNFRRSTLLRLVAITAALLGSQPAHLQERTEHIRIDVPKAQCLNRLVFVSAALGSDAPGSQPQMHVTAELSAKDKIEYGLRQAFFSLGAYIFPGIGAVIIQLGERKQPDKDTGDRIADGFSRYAIEFGTSSSKALLASGVYPIIFNQDPRYQSSHKRGFGARVLHAASRVFVTEASDGRLQPNISRLSGALTASALANAWERNTPGRDRIGVGPTFRRFGIGVGLDVLRFVVLKEFGPDIKKKLLRR